MKTYKELKDFCEKNNVRHEIHPIWSKPWYNPFSREEQRCILGYEIGMNNIAGRKGKSEWQWVWFETVGCPKELTEDVKFTFKWRYSQLNGRTYQGCREGWQANDTIERRS
jgi:hypothetical protein